jgi:hypothetical protein
MSDAYFIGVALAFIPTCIAIGLRIILLWIPSRNMLLLNLDKIGLTWTPHSGILLPKNCSPAAETANYLGRSALKFIMFLALSWIGILFAIAEIYDHYARYRKTHKIMMALKKLSSSIMVDKFDILSLTIQAFNNEIKSKDEENAHVMDLVADMKREAKRKMNTSLDEAQKAIPIVDNFKDDKLLDKLTDMASKNPIWLSTLVFYRSMNPYTAWETHCFSHLFEYEFNSMWELSGVVTRIYLFRLVGRSHNMDTIETGLVGPEIEFLEKHARLNEEGIIRDVYLEARNSFDPKNNDEKAALIIYMILKMNDNFEYPTAAASMKKAADES